MPHVTLKSCWSDHPTHPSLQLGAAQRSSPVALSYSFTAPAAVPTASQLWEGPAGLLLRASADDDEPCTGRQRRRVHMRCEPMTRSPHRCSRDLGTVRLRMRTSASTHVMHCCPSARCPFAAAVEEPLEAFTPPTDSVLRSLPDTERVGVGDSSSDSNASGRFKLQARLSRQQPGSERLC